MDNKIYERHPEGGWRIKPEVMENSGFQMNRATHDAHDYNLEHLMTHLDLIDERPNDLKWMLKEAIMLNKKGNKTPMCDLLLGYDNNFGIPVELKASENHRSHAKEQLHFGRIMLNRLGYFAPHGKIVYYDNQKFGENRFSYEKFPNKNL